MRQLVPQRVSSIIHPKDMAQWSRDGGAQLLTDEFNALLRYLQSREVELEGKDPRHAGFVMAAVLKAVKMAHELPLSEPTQEALSQASGVMVQLASPRMATQALA